MLNFRPGLKKQQFHADTETTSRAAPKDLFGRDLLEDCYLSHGACLSIDDSGRARGHFLCDFSGCL